MNLSSRLDGLIKWGQWILNEGIISEEILMQAYYRNQWFTVENTKHMLTCIGKSYLDPDKLIEWAAKYQSKEAEPSNVGIVMAGNIPLVGFHDLLSVLASGNRAHIKLSSRDDYLLPWLLDKLYEIEPGFRERILLLEQLKDINAVIATGSNNSSRYFDYYFGKYPHIIRNNRSSLAVLDGHESKEDIQELGKDIFRYFGLGCRNVSKLMVPASYDLPSLLDQLESWRSVAQHNKYRNNLDYNLTLLILNRTPHLTSDFLSLVKNEGLSSPISSVYYEFYENDEDLQHKIQKHAGSVQCIVGNGDAYIPFGKSQEPELTDYADDQDTMEFLKNL